MGYNPGNNAYDLSLFEQRQTYVRTTPRAEAGVTRAGGRAGTKGAGSRSRSAANSAEEKLLREHREASLRLARWLAIGIICVIGITMLVGSRVDYHELVMEIEKANAQLTELEQDYEAMRLEFDNKMSDTAVEEYAVNVLGMQKRENSQTEYISLNVGNVFEIGSQQANDWYQTNLDRILSYGD